MDEEINPKIIEKIEKIKNKNIGDFLKEIIDIEFKNKEEGRWLFREEYEKKIKAHLKE